VREVEIIALDNIVEPNADFPGDCIHETTLASETIAYFAPGTYEEQAAKSALKL